MDLSARARRALVAVAGAAGLALSVSGCVVAGGSTSGDNGAGFVFLLLPLALFAMMAFRVAGASRRRRRRAWGGPPVGTADRDVNVELLRAELSVLADDVIRLEPQVVLKEAARDDYEAAAHRYRVAQTALEHTTAPVDLARVQRVVDEANWSMSRARAILDGRTPPPPPEPLQQPGRHGEPAVAVDERDAPVYVDSPAAFRSGWFGGAGGLLGGLLLGPMLGGVGWVVQDELDGTEDGSPEADDDAW